MKRETSREHRLAKDVAFLIEELKKEWAKSKKDYRKVEVTKATYYQFSKDVNGMLVSIQYQLQKSIKETTLVSDLEMLKHGFILARLGGKLLKAEKKAKEKESFVVTLDQDEYQFWKVYYPVGE